MSEITLKKGKFTSTLEKGLHDYYSKGGPLASDYVRTRWQHWKEGTDAIVYLVKNGPKTDGWIIYNKATSAIEDILVNPAIRTVAVDALIAKESLVSAEIPADDKEKVDWLIDYGFRPARKIKGFGLPL